MGIQKSSRVPHPTERAAKSLTNKSKSKKNASQALVPAPDSEEEMQAQLAALTQKLRNREKASRNMHKEVRQQGEPFHLV